MSSPVPDESSMSLLSLDSRVLRMDRKNLVWMDIILIWLQIITQWLTLVDADAVDSVGVVVTVEGDEDVAVVVAERTRRRNGTQIVPNPCRPYILSCGIKGHPSQNLVVL
jgi:hypothetical protein